jgi:hypothetical protein
MCLRIGTYVQCSIHHIWRAHSDVTASLPEVWVAIAQIETYRAATRGGETQEGERRRERERDGHEIETT